MRRNSASNGSEKIFSPSLKRRSGNGAPETYTSRTGHEPSFLCDFLFLQMQGTSLSLFIMAEDENFVVQRPKQMSRMGELMGNFINKIIY
jgi:hypothetical protein